LIIAAVGGGLCRRCRCLKGSLGALRNQKLRNHLVQNVRKSHPKQEIKIHLSFNEVKFILDHHDVEEKCETKVK